MIGDAFATAGSATPELSLQILFVHRENIDAFSRKRRQKICPIESGNLGRLLLGDLTTLVPVDRRGESHLSNELVRRAPQRREDLFGKIEMNTI